MKPHALACALLLAAAALAARTPCAQTEPPRTDQGPKGSRIVGPQAPGAPPPASRAGASNPGGLGRTEADIPVEPATGIKPASASAGRNDRDGLHGRARKGTGGAAPDQVREPDAQGR
ncbi:hypothetical protein [Cupriavidus malaysiensis]|uniref:Translation initiation factor IF-2 n=1 Tax=Cupriavidus malaysiensis TaxID=367825 RepID=A0ABM6FF99_9BURK|nr:hypothetical protein [Cupriavidus malaysiensis]AOZ10595.1 hypothetical protein BKK80_34210 [Cupriavidus malaysiensis]